MWQDKLVAGNTYIMNNIKYVTNQGQYYVYDHPFKLLFIGATFVKEQLFLTILMKIFKFKFIKGVVNSNFLPDLFVGNLKNGKSDLNLFSFSSDFLYQSLHVLSFQIFVLY